ncbi:MAG: nucleotidyltransferase family protein [Desulfobacterales bacterium]|nr:nucleotidyltransferase family protein [Desulfobacterales bacterium]
MSTVSHNSDDLKNLCEKFVIAASGAIRDAVKKMDVEGHNFLVVVDTKDRVLGVFTNGDFRRAVFRGLDINNEVRNIMNRDFLFLKKGFSFDEPHVLFQRDKVNYLPVLDDGKLVGVVLRQDYLSESQLVNKVSKISGLPVAIMAGGKGIRLDPFTRVLPKPLIPLGDSPVIKLIMDQFNSFGISDFYVSLNDKARMIQAYFHDYGLDYKISYIKEETPLGTAGALSYFREKIANSLFVSNCDVIIHCNYESIYEFHEDGAYDLTLVGSMRQYTIPYGVCEIDGLGALKEIREKPNYNFLVNTGVYLVNPSVLRLIPKNTFFNMNDLVTRSLNNGLKVGVFPVSEKAWLDVGQWSEYKRTIHEMNL